MTDGILIVMVLRKDQQIKIIAYPDIKLVYFKIKQSFYNKKNL